jgi:integrase
MILGVMTISNSVQMADTKTAIRKLTTTSKDGKWKSYLTHAGLMQYVPSGVFFARAKVNGVVKRASLDTDVFTTAKDRLRAKIRELRKPPAEIGTFADARLLYEADLDADHTLAPRSKDYRRQRIAALLKTWPGNLDTMKLEKISVTACREWAKKFSGMFDEQNFNNTLGTMRAIIERGGIGHDSNPAFKIKRLGVKPTVLQLPEPEQFEKLIETIDTSGAGQAHHCADFVRFLAYSGCRLSEAQQVTWADVDFERGEIKVHNAKRSRTGNHHPFRFVPIIPAMRQLLEKLRCQNPHAPTDRVCILGECQKSLDRACKINEVSRLTHHDLRHLFATRCIESGVDIPTVSRWLGHVDGGALCMKVYGHLRRSHSQQAAQLVTFGANALPDNAIPLAAVAS